MASIKIYKRLPHILTFYILYLQKYWWWSRNTIFALTPFDGKCQNLQMTSPHFGASSYRFRDNNILVVWPLKGRSTSRSTIIAMTPFHGNWKNLHTSFLHFYFSLRYDMCEVAIERNRHAQRYRHTHTRETEKPIAIREIMQICLKNKYVNENIHYSSFHTKCVLFYCIF